MKKYHVRTMIISIGIPAGYRKPLAYVRSSWKEQQTEITKESNSSARE